MCGAFLWGGCFGLICVFYCWIGYYLAYCLCVVLAFCGNLFGCLAVMDCGGLLFYRFGWCCVVLWMTAVL